MQITTQYASTCPACGNQINVGDLIEWVRGQKAIHAVCPPKVETAPLVTGDTDEATYFFYGEKFYRIPAGKKYAQILTQINGERLNELDQIVKFKYEYVRGMVYNLKPEHKLSLEQAQAFGIKYGICVVCTRKLEDAESVKRGIGPICEERITGVRRKKSKA